MDKIRFYIALFISKFIRLGLKLIKKNATFLPGKIAIKICPSFIGYIGKPETIIGVTGTNGKTTVSNMIIDVLEDNGYDVLNNRFGSNVNSGIASALLGESNIIGKAKKKIAVLEIDERSCMKIYPYIKPNYIVCTNFFRDSIKRNAHTEFITNLLNHSIPNTAKLVLNGDDLICSNIAPENQERVYFGISRLDTDTDTCINKINDVRVCPKCNSKLEYDFVRYHHIGRAHCPKCGFKSPKCNYLITNIDYNNKLITIKTEKEEENYALISDNIINIYNMLATIALLSEFGLEKEKIKESISKIKVVESRFLEEEVNGKSIIMYLAKGQNPVACSRVFDYISKQRGNKAIALMLDDYFDAKDSTENITWLYDADYELLNKEGIEQIVIGGVRSIDHYLRLLLAGYPASKMEYVETELEIADKLNIDNIDKIYILYDMYELHIAKELKERINKIILNKNSISE